jgi:integrase
VLAERAGLAGVTLHTLRHSAASALIASGAHVKVVQEMLGRSSYSITADIYSHANIEQQREAAERLGEALHGERRYCTPLLHCRISPAGSQCPRRSHLRFVGRAGGI